jgi:uncharacterized membrane protein YkvA (DUF1232 family)
MKKLGMIRQTWGDLTAANMPLKRKLLFIGASLAYVVLPIDIAPDFIPLLGQLDDIAVVMLLSKLFISFNKNKK